jgi:C4-dicarboxylate-specific signal transduction histidine kinase
MKAVSLFRAAGANREIAINCETLGLANVQHALFDRADWWFRLALEYREKDAEPVNIALPLIHLGNLHYFHLDNTDSAFIFYTRAKELIEQSGKFYAQGYACDLHDVNLYALVLYYTGNCLKEMQDYDRALEHYNKTLDVLDKDKMKSPRDTGIVILEMAETLHLLGQDSIALSMILQGFKRGFWFLDWEQNFHRYRVAAAIYEGLGNYREALNYQKLFHESEDSADVFYYDRDRLDFFARARAFELAEKNKLLTKDMAIQELKLQRGRLAKWLLAAGLAILFILFAFYLYQYWLKKKLSRELELKVADAIHKHKQQQQIIVHQAGLTSLGEMAAGIAHEINQPLQDLRLLAETMDRDLAKGGLNAGDLSNAIKDQLEDVLKISHIVEHVQVFSSQQKTGTLERFVINEPILAAHSLLGKQFLKDDVKIDFSLQPELPEVMGNPYKFEQVVINLLNNARSAVNEKAGQGNSRFDKKVLVKTSLKASGKQNPSTKAMIIMEVQDNGSGIPEENLTSIFLPFFTTKELGKGIGLGLSISHGIISEMNGTINVLSKVGEGSCFTVELPGAD